MENSDVAYAGVLPTEDFKKLIKIDIATTCNVYQFSKL